MASLKRARGDVLGVKRFESKKKRITEFNRLNTNSFFLVKDKNVFSSLTRYVSYMFIYWRN